jgi:hypothetical protein
MVNPNRFYTYAYLREDRTPYYIGKGTGKRIYAKTGRPCQRPKNKSKIIFLKQNLTEEEAFKHEIYMIAVFGRKDLGTGILHNRTDGGEGTSGFKHSEEIGRKQSEKMRGENNPSYGKKWWNDGCGNTKLSKECPGPNWVLGKSEEIIRKNAESNMGKNKNKRWWNDSFGNRVLFLECPGEGWVLGMGEEIRKQRSLMKWWNDGCGNFTKSAECPGEGWVSGRGK